MPPLPNIKKVYIALLKRLQKVSDRDKLGITYRIPERGYFKRSGDEPIEHPYLWK